MPWAADAVANPDPALLRSTGCVFIARYVGTPYQAYGVSRGYINACHAAGLGVGLIFEEWASQFLSGYDGARAACNRHMATWDALGAPRDGSVIPMVVLVDPNPGVVYGAEAQLQAYARGWDDALVGQYGFPEWTDYGSKYGSDLARAVAPHLTRRWGVRTWGYQAAYADMYQEPNIAPPVANTDYNSLSRLDMGQWGGEGSGPPPKKKWSDDMIYVQNGVVALHMQGPVIAAEFGAPYNTFGVPTAAIDYAGDRIPFQHHVPSLVIEKFRIADKVATTMPTGSGGATPDQVAAVQASVAAQQNLADAMTSASTEVKQAADTLAAAFQSP